jgi:branched-chain amino acid transport system permease protein
MPTSKPDAARRYPVLALAVAVAVLVTTGLVLDVYWLRVLTGVFLFATIAQSINIIAGFTGYPAFGQIVFFGLGAYAVAIASVRLGAPLIAGGLLAVAAGVLFAVACGAPLFRLRGHYFAIGTLGLNEATKAIAANWTSLTGGGAGMSLPLSAGSAAAQGRVFYFAFLLLMLAATAAVWGLGRSRFGYACRAIRADEDGAEATGIDPLLTKTGAWAISAAFAALAGGLYAAWQSYVDPPTVFDMDIAVKGFVIFLLGGPGTVFGPVLAAAALELASALVWGNLLTMHLGVMGILIMLTVLYLPQGFPGLAARCRRHVVAAPVSVP